MTDPALDLTEDAFLGGQLRLRQLKSGHRAGHDAMLLAAATPARPGDRVADLGAGVGAAGLAVARRVGRHRSGSGRDRCGAGGPCARQCRCECDCRRSDRARCRSRCRQPLPRPGLAPDSVDVVLMNPPFNDPARHRISPDRARGIAHVATATTLCELDSRGAPHPQIQGRADADLARRRDCRGAGGARSRFRESGNLAGSRRREGAGQSASWSAPPRAGGRRRKSIPP